MNQICVVVPNIPIINDVSWNSALLAIQKPFLRVGTFDAATETQIQFLEGHWTIILHRVIRKKWHSRHKIPIKKPKEYEPLGEIYFRLLELCIQTHAMSPSGYVSAADWFSRILQGERTVQYRMIFEIATESRPVPKKGEASKLLVDTAADLRNFRNPYDTVQESHMYRLLESAISFAPRRDFDQYAKDYWRPFVAAYSAWARDFQHNSIWNVRFAKDEKIYQTSGPGKNKGIVILARSSPDNR